MIDHRHGQLAADYKSKEQTTMLNKYKELKHSLRQKYVVVGISSLAINENTMNTYQYCMVCVLKLVSQTDLAAIKRKKVFQRNTFISSK